MVNVILFYKEVIMMQGIFAYGGTNNRRTLLSVVVLFVASVLLVMPYYFVYRAVTVLLMGAHFRLRL